MKKFAFLAFVCLLAAPAFGQINYDSRLWGDKIDLLAPVEVQLELDYYTAPWGSVLEGDPAVMGFGIISQEGDTLIMSIEMLGNDDGYAPLDTGPALRNMKFYWDGAVGSYISFVNDDPKSKRFQAITIHMNTGVYRQGILKWDPAGYPWWVIWEGYLQEWSIKERTVEPWRHSTGERRAPTGKKE